MRPDQARGPTLLPRANQHVNGWAHAGGEGAEIDENPLGALQQDRPPGVSGGRIVAPERKLLHQGGTDPPQTVKGNRKPLAAEAELGDLLHQRRHAPEGKCRSPADDRVHAHRPLRPAPCVTGSRRVYETRSHVFTRINVIRYFLLITVISCASEMRGDGALSYTRRERAGEKGAGEKGRAVAAPSEGRRPPPRGLRHRHQGSGARSRGRTAWPCPLPGS